MSSTIIYEKPPLADAFVLNPSSQTGRKSYLQGIFGRWELGDIRSVVSLTRLTALEKKESLWNRFTVIKKGALSLYQVFYHQHYHENSPLSEEERGNIW